MNVVVGELLICTAAGVPEGPPAARAAWAKQVGALFEVVIGGGPEEARVICRSHNGCRPVKAWWELERLDGVSCAERVLKPDPQCSGPGYAHAPHGDCLGYATDRT